jgi:hypothetical protein
MTSIVSVAFEDMPVQAFVDCPRTDDEQVVVLGQPAGDVVYKSLEMLETVRLAGVLRAATATVTNARIVPDVTGGPVASGHVRVHSFESNPVALPADDDGLPRVDPDEGAGSRPVGSPRGVLARRRSHDRAQAGPVSASTARSA